MKILFRIAVVCIWGLFFWLLLYLSAMVSFQPDRSINLFMWGNSLDSESIQQFELETGIRVNVNYYSSNEELVAKLLGQRESGYDLIIPTDYAIKTLVSHNLLERIQHHRLPFLKDLDPSLLNHAFDPGNQFSIPVGWDVFCIGIDTDVVPLKPEPSWEYIFTYPRELGYRIAMTNQAGEAMFIAGRYLGTNDMVRIAELLRSQHEIVEAYTDARPDYFLQTKNCPVIVGISSYVVRCMRSMPSVDLVIPREGSIITVEHVAIPVGSKKQDLVYAFINFLYRPDVVRKRVEKFGVCPALITSEIVSHIDPEVRKLVTMSTRERSRLFFYENTLSESMVNELWISVKS